MGKDSITASMGLALHLICGLGMVGAYWIATYVYELSPVTDPARTLRLIVAVEGPIVIGVYSLVRSDPERCSYWKAVGRGLLGLPLGALLNAFGGIVLGAPLGIEYLTKTISWSLFMSLLTFVPAVCVFGSSRNDWQRLLDQSKTTGELDSMISLPAHGAVIGAWLGAWPMPLDWDRPWQDWPICVTYGAVVGYFFGMIASLAFKLLLGRKVHVKRD